MKANMNSTVDGAVCGKLISLFGRKVKPTSETAERTDASEPVAAGQACRGRVLVVDDDPVMLKATENKLRAHGYAVSTALDGPSAIESARRERPDLILLDLVFPPDLPMSWDGFSIMEWLRQASWVRSTPIILCTASHDHELMQRAQAAHAAGLFQKPVDYTALLGLIEHYVKAKERPAPGLVDAAARN